jgi:hypothetical protein
MKIYSSVLVHTDELIIVEQIQQALVHIVRGVNRRGLVHHVAHAGTAVSHVVHIGRTIKQVNQQLIRGEQLGQRGHTLRQHMVAGTIAGEEALVHGGSLRLDQGERSTAISGGRVMVAHRRSGGGKHIIGRRHRGCLWGHGSNKGGGTVVIAVDVHVVLFLGRALGGPRSLATNVADQVVLTTNELRMMEHAFLINTVGASKAVQV